MAKMSYKWFNTEIVNILVLTRIIHFKDIILNVIFYERRKLHIIQLHENGDIETEILSELSTDVNMYLVSFVPVVDSVSPLNG